MYTVLMLILLSCFFCTTKWLFWISITSLALKIGHNMQQINGKEKYYKNKITRKNVPKILP